MSRKLREELRAHYNEVLKSPDVSFSEGKRAEYNLSLYDLVDKMEEEAEKKTKEDSKKPPAKPRGSRWL